MFDWCVDDDGNGGSSTKLVYSSFLFLPSFFHLFFLHFSHPLFHPVAIHSNYRLLCVCFPCVVYWLKNICNIGTVQNRQRWIEPDFVATSFFPFFFFIVFLLYLLLHSSNFSFLQVFVVIAFVADCCCCCCCCFYR